MAATLEDLDENTTKELALLARQLSDDPKTRPQFLKLMKQARPDTPVPELEIDERIAAVQSKSDEEISKLQAKLAEREMRDELNKRRQALKDKGLAQSDEDVAAIEALMLKDGITNHETAGEFLKYQRIAAPPTPPSYDRNFMNQSAQDLLKPYWKNPSNAARASAADALKDIRTGKVRLA